MLRWKAFPSVILIFVICYEQIVDSDGNEVSPGKEGDIALRVKPNRPLGLFTKYLVRFRLP